MNDTELAIFLTILLGIFAYLGFRHGVIAELVKFGILLFAAAVYNPDLLGDVAIRVINSIYFFFVIAFNGGISLILTGDFSADKLADIMEAAKEKTPLIKPDQTELVLFILMVFLVILAFVISSRVTRKSSPGLGLFMGIVNGLLTFYLFLPTVSGGGLLPDLPADSPLHNVLAIFVEALHIVLLPVAWLYERVGTWIIAIGILVVLFIALRALRKGS